MGDHHVVALLMMTEKSRATTQSFWPAYEDLEGKANKSSTPIFFHY
jgi:hypothetical protein